MTVGEMELVGRLGEVEPLPQETYDRARASLQAAIALSADPTVTELDRHPKRRRTRALRGGIGAGVAAAAVAAAVALVATGPGPTTKAPAPIARPASPLVNLADYISASAAPTGDATLVARTTDGITVYDLYTDNGRYYFSQTEQGLPAQVAANHDQADGVFAREVAAARLAATGQVQKAGEAMASAPLPSKVVPQDTSPETVDPADAKKPGVYPGEVVGTLYDNYLWENSQDALVAGSGDPQVRAGVLRLLATLPGVTVTHGSFERQPILVLTSGTAEVGPEESEELTINDKTGVPISETSGAKQTKASVTYQVSRVTTAGVAAGKF